MSKRLTVNVVREIFKEVKDAAERLGLVPDGHTLALQEGNTSGIAYRIYLRDNASHGAMVPRWVRSDGYIGTTAREAWDTMETMLPLMHAMLDAQARDR